MVANRAHVSQNTIFKPVPFLMLTDNSLALNIRQQITDPPDVNVLPWKLLPAIDEKAIAYKRRLEELRREKEEKRKAEEEEAARKREGFQEQTSFRLPSAFSDVGKIDGSPINFSAAGNSSFLSNLQHSKDSQQNTSSQGFGFSISGGHTHRAKKSGDEAPKRRRNMDNPFVAGNMQMDIFSHDK